MSTLTGVAINKANIKKYAKDPEITKIKHVEKPFYFVYKTNRSTGSYFYVFYKHNRAFWEKIGSYPETPPAEILSNIESFSVNGKLKVDDFKTVSELMQWYRDRVVNDPHKKRQEKSNTKSVINNHILPLIGELKLKQLTKTDLDSSFFIPMRNNHELSYVKYVFKVLKAAFSLADGLHRIKYNPLEKLFFTKFTKTKIKPKDAAIIFNDVPQVKAQLNQYIDIHYQQVFFSLFLLMHGTRVNETRLIRWSYVDFNNNVIRLPKSITKTHEEQIIPLSYWVIKMLKQYRNKYSSRHKFIFGKEGKPICEKTAYNWVVKASDNKWSPHDLRKFFSDTLVQRGVNINIVDAFLNHAESMLFSTYNQSDATRLMREVAEEYHRWLVKDCGFVLMTKTIPERDIDSHAHRLLG